MGQVSKNPDVDNFQKLQITIHKAKNLKNHDLVGKSDPYVVINSGKQEFKSNVVKNSLNPEWNWTTDILIDRSNPEINLSVYDSDKFGKDDLMGAFNLQKDHTDLFKTKGATWKKFDAGKEGEILISCKLTDEMKFDI